MDGLHVRPESGRGIRIPERAEPGETLVGHDLHDLVFRLHLAKVNHVHVVLDYPPERCNRREHHPDFLQDPFVEYVQAKKFMPGHVLALVPFQRTLLAGIVEKGDEDIHPVVAWAQTADHEGSVFPHVPFAVHLRMSHPHHFLFDKREQVPIVENGLYRILGSKDINQPVGFVTHRMHTIHAANVANREPYGN
jgi:hypothetical protein